MIKHFFISLSLMLVFLFLFSCSGEKTEARNMEQIYKEDGVPVRTVMVEPGLFESKLSYHAILTGIEESSAYASIGDRVEKIWVNVGDYVKKDQVLVTFPTDNPAAQYYQAKVAYDNAKTAYERISKLYESGGISLQNFDNAKAQYEVAKANYNAVSQMVRVLAPMEGYVTKISVVESDHVKNETELVTVSRTDRLKTKIWVSENEIRQMKTGLPATAAWGEKVLNGKVVQLDMAINQMSQSFGAVLEFENTGGCLHCGVTAKITVVTYKNPNAIRAEFKNIMTDADGRYVFVAVNGVAEKRRVKEGERQNLMVEIVDGLNQGDQLIVEGQMLLEPGSKVKIVE